MNTINRLICAIFRHKYIVLARFSRHERKLGCTRCGQQWGMHDKVQALVPWDSDLEDLYRGGAR